MADNYLVVTKDNGYSIKETVNASSEFEARNKSQFADAGLHQTVQRLTIKPDSDKK